MATQTLLTAKFSSLSIRCSSNEQTPLSQESSQISFPRKLSLFSLSTPKCFSENERLAIDPSANNSNVMWAKGGFNVEIFVGEQENSEQVVRRFRKVVMDANIINECRRRRYFENPQEKAKRKQKDAARARRLSRPRPSGGFKPRTDYKEGSQKLFGDEDDFWGGSDE